MHGNAAYSWALPNVEDQLEDQFGCIGDGAARAAVSAHAVVLLHYHVHTYFTNSKHLPSSYYNDTQRLCELLTLSGVVTTTSL